jgi:oxygen-independent coproporphyrinogen-3 oxidase
MQPSVDATPGPDLGSLAERLGRAGPRYTSYPTANLFDGRVGPAEHAAALARHGATGAPVSLYVHLPFCRSLCHYCACNVVITRRAGAAADYLDHLEREADLVAAALGRPVPVTQLHLGGGTPTYLTPDELRRLGALLAARFDLGAAEERSVEVDPRVTTPEHVAALAELGFDRVSFGVQDFDPAVQAAIRRQQTFEQTLELARVARAAGVRSLNVDLIHGLPFQRPETFGRTLERVLALGPDRVALYAYAHVPWLRPAQASFDRRGYPVPSPAERVALFELAHAALTGAGYVHLGLDHFARPEDELALALARGALHRNFQGYTVRRADAVVGLGCSAISDVGGLYAQAARDLSTWREALAGGRLSTEKGWILSAEDVARRGAVLAVMTGGALPEGFLAARPEVRAGLAALAADGLVRLGADQRGGLEVTPLGRRFLRNVAMAFDAHLAPGARHTRTV